MPIIEKFIGRSTSNIQGKGKQNLDRPKKIDIRFQPSAELRFFRFDFLQRLNWKQTPV